MQVNDGSAQRSEVRSITVGFKGTATFSGNPAAAFQLAGVGGGASGTVPLTATVVNADGSTNVILTFSPAGSGTDPVSAVNGGAPSLADGRYQLTVNASGDGERGRPGRR